MRKLFTGRFHRIPIAVLSVVLLGVLVTGGVVAAVSGGYVLWQASSNITVTEPITILYGPTEPTCTTPLLISTPAPMHTISAGACADLWFKLSSSSGYNLLIKAESTVSDPAVTVEWRDALGGSSPIGDVGLSISSSNSTYIFYRHVCVAGNATPATYAVWSQFTRESPP